MTVTKITTHQIDALNRLLEQYREKPNLAGTLNSFNTQIQELEDAIFDLIEDRSLNSAIGVQLDQLGKIIGIERQGFDDDFYRILLFVQIGINVSQGEPEKVIDVFKLLTEASIVHLQEWFKAGVGLGTNSSIDPTLVNFFLRNIQRVVPAGVRVDHIWCWVEDDAFAFAGGPGIAKGFDDLLAPGDGGQFAFLHLPTEPAFAFLGDGLDTDDGFGDLTDPLIGGIFA